MTNLINLVYHAMKKHRKLLVSQLGGARARQNVSFMSNIIKTLLQIILICFCSQIKYHEGFSQETVNVFRFYDLTDMKKEVRATILSIK